MRSADPSGQGRVFGAIADEYDRVRPSYPPEVIGRIIAAGMLTSRSALALEIGAGTGIATRQLLDGGARVHAIEPDESMASKMRSLLGSELTSKQLTIQVASFEDLAGADCADRVGRFDAIVAAQCWHWTEPQTRWQIAHQLLRPHGIVAVMWNQDRSMASPLVEEVYRRFAPELASFGFGMHAAKAAADGDESRFAEDNEFTVDWDRHMSVGDFVALRRTQSDHLLLGPDVLDNLLRELTKGIGGSEELIVAPQRTTLRLFRRRGDVE